MARAWFVVALFVVAVFVAPGVFAQQWVPDVDAPSMGAGWSRHSFESAIVGEAVGYYLYLPPGYADANERFPVMYWLHGLGGSPASAAATSKRLPAAIASGTAPPFIIVSCTDATKRSMWTDSKDGTVPVESVIVKELVVHIDTTYRTIADRSARAIDGFSMGGYGAAYIGFKYPETFGSVSMLAAALHTAESLKTNRRSIFDGVHSGDMDAADRRSPWSVVVDNADTIRGRTKVRMFVGSEDGLLERNERYHALLDELGIDHEWGVVPDAPHNLEVLFQNWEGDPLAYYAEAFAVLATN